MKLSDKKNKFGATLSNRISKNDLRIESVDNLVGTVRDREIAATTKNLYRLLLDENLDYLVYKVFADEKEFLPKGAIASLTPTTMLRHRYVIRGNGFEMNDNAAFTKIKQIESFVKENDAEIVSCGFKIGGIWLVKTCNILIFDSWKYDRETGRMVVWPDDKKFELGWEVVDLKADQEEPQS